MRRLLFLVVVVSFLVAVRPATAQLRSQTPQTERSPTKLYRQDATSFSLNNLFDPADFRMDHAYTLSAGSFTGGGYSYGLYTNTMRWQPNDKLAARVDVGFVHSPFSTLSGESQGLNGQLFLQNAEIAYRPTENVQLRFVMKQHPYGRFMQPHGYAPVGYRSGYGTATGQVSHHALFWKNHQ